MTEKPTVLFVCVHNAGRSQMAAGFLRALAGDDIDVLSAGSEPKDQINQVAIEAMAEDGIDIAGNTPKVLTVDAVRESDVVITMGCGDACPIFPGKRYEDWELEDPAGKDLVTVRRVRDVLPEAAFGLESLAGFAHEAAYLPRWNPEPLLGVGDIESFLTDSVAKLLVRSDGTPGDDMLDAAAPVLDGLVEVTHSNVNDSLLELSALGVNKATTTARLADEWGIAASEVVAFGDMPNDVELLRWAGRGYAVGNAHPLALDAADEHAPSIDDDGVAQVLERLLRA